MNQFLPDWMFAAFAIGGWELFDLVARHYHYPHARYAGGSIVVICILVLCVRYITRFVQRRRHPEQPNPDEWKSY